ncbi:MAG TPA: response regulator, partial [Candidatus Aminicenantes bacterium]|nr:response regulator [Candidatus Aminicenantes bacterium]
TGIGMSEEVKEKLFEPFFTTKERGKGTGLGLSIVYAVVRQYNGIIQVDSVYGYGSTFEIYLPACTEAPKPSVENGGEEDKGGGEVVLLVEDDEGVRNFAREVLTENGYRVYAASGGEEALGVIRSEGVKPKLLFTDLVMPGMNGLTLTKKVATLFAEIRVLIASGYSEYDKEEIGEAKLPEGRVHFVSKPYTLQEIVQRVRAALASP